MKIPSARCLYVNRTHTQNASIKCIISIQHYLESRATALITLPLRNVESNENNFAVDANMTYVLCNVCHIRVIADSECTVNAEWNDIYESLAQQSA